MATIEQITQLLKDSEERIVSRLESSIEEKVTKITEKALDNINKSVNNNSETIRDIEQSVEIIKENTCKNNEDLSEIKEDVAEYSLKIQNMEKYKELTEMRLKDIEEVLNEKAYSMSFADKQKIKNIEQELNKLKESKNNDDDNIVKDNDKQSETDSNRKSFSSVLRSVPKPKPNNIQKDSEIIIEKVTNNMVKIVDMAKAKIGLLPM